MAITAKDEIKKTVGIGTENVKIPAGYKLTELGIIPKDWEVVLFSDLLEFRNGVNADKMAYGKGIPFINVLEIITHTHLSIAKIPGRITLSRNVANLYNVQHGDILFNRTSETQKELGLASTYISKSNDNIVFGGFVIRGRLKGNRIDAEYSGYAFRSPLIRSQIVSRGQGAIRANIGQYDLSQITTIIPSVKEQQAIAAAISDIDSLITNLNQLIAKKRYIKQAAMEQLLTGKRRLPGFSGEWKSKKLGDIGSTFGGLTGKSKEDFNGGTARYIPFLNIMNNVIIDPVNLGFVRVSPSEGQHQTIKGDLFFNGSSETPEELGMCSVLLEDMQNVYLNSFCFGFRLHKPQEVYGLYLAYFFRSNIGRKLFYSLAQGSTRYNLSKNNFSNLIIHLPCSNEQITIANILSDMDTEITSLEQQLDKARNLKQGMMQELLTGRIRLI